MRYFFHGVLLVILVINTSFGRTYYFSANGNDNNSGLSPRDAWRTPGKIAQLELSPGDSVLFKGGDSIEGGILISLPVKETPGQFIVFSSYPSETGSRAVLNSVNDYGFKSENTGGIKIVNLEFTGAGRTKNNTGGIYLDINEENSYRHNIIIDSVDVNGYKWSGISFGSYKSNSGYYNVTISNSHIHDNGDAGISSFGIDNESYNNGNITIINNKVFNNAGVPEKGTHSGNGIVIGYADNVLIEYNEAYNNGWLNDNTSGGPVGIWCWESNNVTIQFNESHHNKTGTEKDGGGFDLDGGTSNSVIQYNYSHDNEGPGYLLAQFEGASRMLKNVVIRYNISINDDSGVMFWSAGSAGGIKDAYIYNNTIITGSPWGGVSIISDSIFNCYVLNNIIVARNGACPVNAEFTPDIKFFGNCYWSDGEKFKIKWGEKEYTSLINWRLGEFAEALNNKPSGIEANPGIFFMNKESLVYENYNLKGLKAGYEIPAGSPVINTAVDLKKYFNIDGGTRDFRGKIIVDSKRDIGAIEK